MSASIASSLLFLLASSCGWCGELSLKYALPGTDHGAVHTSPAIRPSDGWVFFGTDDMSSPANSRVYAYDPGVGEEWEFALPNGQPTFSSPALSADGARLYFGDDNGTLYALDATTGGLQWSISTGQAIRSSPAISTNLAYGIETVWVTSNDGNLYVAWFSSGTAHSQSSAVGAGPAVQGGQFTSSPVIAADGTVYVASANTTFYAFGFDYASMTLTQLWTFQNPGFFGFVGSPAIGPDGTIYVGDNGGNLVAIDPIAQAQAWSFPFPTQQMAEGQPVVARDGTIYVGNDDGNFYALSPSGSELWSVNCTNPIVASPALTADGYAYVVTFGTTEPAGEPLLVIDLSQQKVVNTSDQNLTDYIYDSSPAIASDGTIFVGMDADDDGADDTGDVLAIAPQSSTSTLALGFYPKFRSNNRNSGNAQDNRWTETPPPVATITDLGTFDNYNDYSEGAAVNDLDYSTGFSQDARISSTYQDAFLYNPSTGTMTDLGHIIDNDVTTTGLGINIGNTVVGYQQNAGGSQLGWVWTQHAGMHELPWSGLGDFYAYGVNAGGEIVGYGIVSSGYSHALYWRNSSQPYNDLGTLGGYTSYAYGMNDAGYVVGQADASSGAHHAFVVLRTSPSLTDLGTIGNATGNSVAYAINGIGQIAGTSIGTDGRNHVFLKNQLSAWNTGFQDLGTPSPTFAAINGRGQVVTGDNHIYVPALGTTLQPLANYLSSTDKANWTLENTDGISSDGTVVGWGYHSGAAHAYMIQVK